MENSNYNPEITKLILDLTIEKFEPSKWKDVQPQDLVLVLAEKVIELQKKAISTEKVTRVEVIDFYGNKGRIFFDWQENNEVKLSLQDENRTLKIFISKKE